MSALPTRIIMSDAPSPNNLQARTWHLAIRDFLSGLFGDVGTPATARAALGVPASTEVLKVSNLVADGQNNVSPTNNTPLLQAHINAVGAVTVKDGVYRFQSGVSNNYGAIVGIGNPSVRYSIKGESRNNTIFWQAGTGRFLDSTGGYAVEGLHSFDVLKDFTLISINYKLNNGIRYNKKAYYEIDGLHLSGYAEALRLDACFTGSISNTFLRDSNYGLIIDGTAFPDAANAINIRRLTCQLNSNFGIYAPAFGEGNHLDGLTIEACGTQGSVNTGGIHMLIQYANGFGASTISNSYFELNKGGADLYIENKQNKKAVIILDACFFNRASSTAYTDTNIKLRNTGGGSLTVIMRGCSFFSTDTYVPSAARPFFDIGTGCELVNGGGNSFSEVTSLPNNAANRPSQSSETFGGDVDIAGAIQNSALGITASKAGTGVYLVTHASGFGIDVNAYSATATSTYNGAGRIVQRVTRSNATTITVTTTDMTGAAIDCPFAFHVVKRS